MRENPKVQTLRKADIELRHESLDRFRRWWKAKGIPEVLVFSENGIPDVKDSEPEDSEPEDSEPEDSEPDKIVVRCHIYQPTYLPGKWKASENLVAIYEALDSPQISAKVECFFRNGICYFLTREWTGPVTRKIHGALERWILHFQTKPTAVDVMEVYNATDKSLPPVEREKLCRELLDSAGYKNIGSARTVASRNQNQR